MAAENSDLWTSISARWDRLGPPLRPSADDLDLLERQLRKTRPNCERILVLGSTADYRPIAARLSAEIVACDLSGPMLHGVWRQPDHAIRGNWLDLPFAAGSFDVVLGDGIFTLLPFPTAYRALSQEVHRVLRPEGVFGIRAFLDAHRDEGMEAVQSLVSQDAVSNSHELRFRIAMALQTNPSEGIPVRKLYEYWTRGDRLEIDLQDPKWKGMEMMEIYASNPDRYAFPILEELCEVLGKQFVEAACGTTTSGYGEFCPTMLWQRGR